MRRVARRPAGQPVRTWRQAIPGWSKSIAATTNSRVKPWSRHRAPIVRHSAPHKHSGRVAEDGLPDGVKAILGSPVGHDGVLPWSWPHPGDPHAGRPGATANAQRSGRAMQSPSAPAGRITNECNVGYIREYLNIL